MDPDEVELRRGEYYDTLEDSESLHAILNENAGLVLARVGSYPPWPARFSEPGEYAKMSKYRLKKSHVCVYFFGTRNFGWVPKSSILSFSTDISALKSTKKYNSQLMHEALDEAKFILDGTDSAGLRFYDRILERRSDVVDLPCEICNRVDDHYSNLILCDGVDCKREFHMNCLVPPLVAVPPGDWYCPECAKDPSKQLTTTTRHPTHDAMLGGNVDDTPLSATISQQQSLPQQQQLTKRSSKKDKQKHRDGSLKRRLQSETELFVTSASTVSSSASRPSAKRSRFPRAAGESSVESSPSKSISVPEASPPRDALPPARKPSTLSVAAAAANVQAGANATGSSVESDSDSDIESDERCLVCQYGGDVIVCEFPGCAKVFHQFCLGAYPFPRDDDVAWHCPRHTCALSGDVERVAGTSSNSSDNDSSKQLVRGVSPRKPLVKTLFWKCTQCPLALSPDKFPPLPTTSIFSKKLRSFLCPNCSPNAPAKVQLGRVLERVWAAMATNRQGLPFCGPLLAGLAAPDELDGDVIHDTSGRRALDLFAILAKVRGLEYEHSSSFVADVHALVSNALAIIGNRSAPLAEAAQTIALICREQTGIHHVKLSTMDSKVKRSALEARKQKEQKDGGPWSWKRNWPVTWRSECGGADRRRFPRIEPRSLAEWTVYVTSAPLYASADALDDRLEMARAASLYGDSSHDVDRIVSSGGGGSYSSGESGPRAGAAMAATSSAWADNESHDAAGSSSSDTQSSSFPGLSLSEGTDIMLALGTLARSGRDRKRLPPQLGGAKEGDYDDVDARDFFLSPSTSEMQQMLEQQSLLLRQALEAQTALHKSWLLSQQGLLGLGDHNGFSVGEGRLAAELRLANKNLRARLRNKDRLVDQLSTDHTALQAELAALQRELNESKLRVQELERQRSHAPDSARAIGETGRAMPPPLAGGFETTGSGDAMNGMASSDDALQRLASGRFARTTARKGAK